MENEVTPLPQTNTLCAACYSAVTNDDDYCANCGYPLKGSEFDQKTFIAVRNNVDIDLDVFHKKVQKAGNTLYYLSGLFVFFSIILFFQKKDDVDVLAYVVPNLILAILFLALGGYSRKK